MYVKANLRVSAPMYIEAMIDWYTLDPAGIK